MRATAWPWFPSVAVTSVAPGRRSSTWRQAHEAPRILNAGRPSRDDSSFTSTRPTPSSAAIAGTGTSGVGAYPGSDRWNAQAPHGADGPVQSRAADEKYHDIMRIIIPATTHQIQRENKHDNV